MTNSDGDRPIRTEAGSAEVPSTSLLGASRRTFLGLVGVASGASAVGASDEELPGYGEGGFGEGGFGEGGSEGPADRNVAYYADDSGTVTGLGASNALQDWQAGEIDTSLLLDVINAWQRGDVVE